MQELAKEVTLFEDYLDIWAISAALNEYLDSEETINHKEYYDAEIKSDDIFTEYIIRADRKHLIELKDILLDEETSAWPLLYQARVYDDKIMIEVLYKGNWILDFLNYKSYYGSK